MREIEVKATVVDREKLISAITTAGYIVSEPVTQHDRVFAVEGAAGKSSGDRPWLRIRTETKNNQTTHVFNLKKSITHQMDSIEHETEIIDDGELEKIILHMNFTPYSDLTKQRQKAQIGDIEICIDYIAELGSFVEAEKMTADDADPELVAIELWKVLEQFGVSRIDQVLDGYDVLMNKKLGKE